MPKRVDLAVAFWTHVVKTETCWLWVGAKNEHGYGTLGNGQRKTVKAHRVSYEMAYGPIPLGGWVLHHCDVKACVRPDHLHLGTRADNAREATERRRIQSGEQHWSKRQPERIANGERNGHARLTAEQVTEARRRYAEGGVLQRELAAEYGVTRESMRDAINGKNWGHI